MTENFGHCDFKVMDVNNIHNLTKCAPDLTVLAISPDVFL
jgi:hypothetical protein